MNMDEGYFDKAGLIIRYLRGTLSNEERRELDAWRKLDDRHEALFRKLTEEETLLEALKGFEVPDRDASLRRILDRVDKQASFTKKRIVVRLAAAASVVMLGALGAFWWAGETEKTVVSTALVNTRETDVLPGGNSAILTLSDGRKIDLSAAESGVVATEGRQQILKTADGRLVYQSPVAAVRRAQGTADYFHKVETPRGGQYRLELPDGTRVWLNAASSLRFPAAFNESERVVELDGEAFFEVNPALSSRGKKPFIVRTGEQQVRVLGTHFNVNGYADEGKVTTTLIEGSVQVAQTSSGKKQGVVLAPGQQATVSTGSSLPVRVERVETDEFVAWKEGNFQFKDTDLATIMRQVARWYDVEVVYQGEVPDVRFRGKISRQVPVSQLFEILKTSGINFRIEGRKIIIS
ncbi:DUF4974 domain-containing protein [Ravibacter arvi]|uniref:DUF4974 domain-containing protein n=1 Tax=Ravibacter arvi TaxID=2051041 RepID=A0ABP8LNQ8_9BACT